MNSRFAPRPMTASVAAGSMALALTLAGSAYAATSHDDAASPACSAGTTVTTTKGKVCGLTADGVTTYGSIPYAAPPVGKLRWKSPQPAKAWQGTLQATTEPVECSNVFTTTGTSEDCLNVKVQVPADAKPGEKLPVMFEFHGGGFLGEARTDNGSNLVRTGRVVYVYVNYRLGVLGFLAAKSLGAHSGDYGLQDQQAGLRWVKKNISRFGGDPNNVTVFGESAGGASTCAQVASPTAKGLFKNAISVSGFYNYQNNIVWSNADCKSTYFTEAQAQQAGAAFAQKVGCGDVADVAACLRKIPADELIKEGGQVGDPTGGGTIGPIVNGTTLTMSPVTALTTGHANRVNLITDVGRDEFNGGVYNNNFTKDIEVAETSAQYRMLVKEQFGPLASTVEKLYPLARFASPYTAYRTIMADSGSVCPMLQLDKKASKFMPVYADLAHPADLVEVLTGNDTIHARIRRVPAEAREEILGFDRAPYLRTPDANLEPELERLREGVLFRVIYDCAAVGMPGRLESDILPSIALHEKARVRDTLPMKMFVGDRRTAVIPISSGSGAADAAYVIHPCALLDALLALFEAEWERATPITRNGIGRCRKGPPEDAMQLLTLLAAGHTDESIACALGWSARTAQRRSRS